jgi:hypothetical protein
VTEVLRTGRQDSLDPAFLALGRVPADRFLNPLREEKLAREGAPFSRPLSPIPWRTIGDESV